MHLKIPPKKSLVLVRNPSRPPNCILPIGNMHVLLLGETMLSVKVYLDANVSQMSCDDQETF